MSNMTLSNSNLRLVTKCKSKFERFALDFLAIVYFFSDAIACFMSTDVLYACLGINAMIHFVNTLQNEMDYVFSEKVTSYRQKCPPPTVKITHPLCGATALFLKQKLLKRVK